MDLLKSICPLWSFDERNWPEFLGSSTLVKFGAAHFLISCAHVADLAAGRDIYFPSANGLSKLTASGRITNPPAGKGREADRGDIVFLRLTDECTVAIAQVFQFATADQMAAGKAAISSNYMFAGYPTNRSQPRGRGVLRPELYSLIAGSLVEEDFAALSVSPLTHVGIRMHGAPIKDMSGQPTTMPDYNGISGGAVIAFAYEHQRNPTIEPKLVGFCMERPPERPNVMLGVRLVAALDGIRARHPELASLIPADPDVKAVWEPGTGTA